MHVYLYMFAGMYFTKYVFLLQVLDTMLTLGLLLVLPCFLLQDTVSYTVAARFPVVEMLVSSLRESGGQGNAKTQLQHNQVSRDISDATHPNTAEYSLLKEGAYHLVGRRASYNRGHLNWPLYLRVVQRRYGKPKENEVDRKQSSSQKPSRLSSLRYRLWRIPHVFGFRTWTPGKRNVADIAYSTDDVAAKRAAMSSIDGRWYWPFYWPNFRPSNKFKIKPKVPTSTPLSTEAYTLNILHHWPFHGFSNLLPGRSKLGKRETNGLVPELIFNVFPPESYREIEKRAHFSYGGDLDKGPLKDDLPIGQITDRQRPRETSKIKRNAQQQVNSSQQKAAFEKTFGVKKSASAVYDYLRHMRNKESRDKNRQAELARKDSAAPNHSFTYHKLYPGTSENDADIVNFSPVHYLQAVPSFAIGNHG